MVRPDATLTVMITAMLLLIVAGIGLTQAVSDPHQVTLRWLRLGGLIALALLVGAAVVVVVTEVDVTAGQWTTLALATAAFLTQSVSVQSAKHAIQRLAAALGFVLALSAAGPLAFDSVTANWVGPGNPWKWSAWLSIQARFQLALSGGLLGGFLMTMLLGHAYLTAGNEMTQKPFMRLVVMLAILLLLRIMASSALGLWPFLHGNHTTAHVWDVMMVTVRFLIGLAAPAVFTYMVFDCVKRRANQSATGILYVTLVMVIIGEGTALTLLGQTGKAF